MLPSPAWGFNQHGHGHSINALYPLLSPANTTVGLAVNFVARNVLEATSLDDAVRRASVPAEAGQHFNMGNTHTPDEQVMVECAPGAVNVRRLHTSDAKHAAAPVVAYHANLYESEQFKGIDGGTSPSSLARMARMKDLAQALLLQRTAPSVGYIGGVLSDTADPNYPIHRNAAAGDCCLTLASVVFDVGHGRVNLWGNTSPAATGEKPLRTYAWGK